MDRTCDCRRLWQWMDAVTQLDSTAADHMVSNSCALCAALGVSVYSVVSVVFVAPALFCPHITAVHGWVQPRTTITWPHKVAAAAWPHRFSAYPRSQPTVALCAVTRRHHSSTTMIASSGDINRAAQDKGQADDDCNILQCLPALCPR